MTKRERIRAALERRPVDRVVPLDVPEAHLTAVVEAVKARAAR